MMVADADADADDGVYARVEVNQRALIDKVRGILYHTTLYLEVGETTTSSSYRSFSFFFFRSLFFFDEKQKQKQKQKRNALPIY